MKGGHGQVDFKIPKAPDLYFSYLRSNLQGEKADLVGVGGILGVLTV